ncbi:MAG: 50S ribosomal protein L21 [Thermosulfidibacteraceae bacterium]|jgi:large subunit ribosomal protein L21
MFAVVETGSKQYMVKVGDRIRVEKLPYEVGSEVELDRVLFVSGDVVKVGDPLISGAKVVAKVVAHGRGKKIIGMKFKRRKNYRRKWGHRQWYTELEIVDIRA